VDKVQAVAHGVIQRRSHHQGRGRPQAFKPPGFFPLPHFFSGCRKLGSGRLAARLKADDHIDQPCSEDVTFRTCPHITRNINWF